MDVRWLHLPHPFAGLAVMSVVDAHLFVRDCVSGRARLCFWGFVSAQAMGPGAKLHGQCAPRLAIEGLPGTVHAGGVAGVKGLLCALGRTFGGLGAESRGFLAVLHMLLVFKDGGNSSTAQQVPLFLSSKGQCVCWLSLFFFFRFHDGIRRQGRGVWHRALQHMPNLI